MFLGQLGHVGGDVDVVILGAQRLLVPHHALHAHEVDDALELLLGADRKLDGDRLGAEPVDDILEALVEVRADLVHLVAEDDARHLVLVALTPDRLGLRLDALVGIEHADGAVEHAQRALHLDGEVDVAGRIDDVETMLLAVRGQNAVVAADVIVMPRSCSCSMKSMVAAPSCTSPILWLLPV